MTKAWTPNLQISVDEALTLVVAWKQGQTMEARKVRTAGAAAGALRKSASKTLSLLDGSSAVSYGPDAHIDSGEYMAVPGDVIEGEGLEIQNTLEHAAGLDVLDPHDIPDRLWFYAAVIGDTPGKRAGFVRKTNPHVTVKPGGFIGTLGETLTKVDDPIFVLEDRFDLVVLPDGVLVLRDSAFEMLFRGAPELAERILVWGKALTANLPIVEGGAEALLEVARRNSRVARRLRSIFEQGHLKGVTIAKLRKVARVQGLDEATLFDGDKLLIDDNTDADTLVRLLNEDLFTGDLSGRKFAADRKRPR